MNNSQDDPSSSDAGGRLHIVQPLRDLELNWAVDLAKQLEEYLLKICSGEISGEDDNHLSVNFAEAALLLQGSIQVYSRKVEYLYSLVLQALEFISQKSQNVQPENASVEPEESSSNAVPDEENDPFWVLEHIPVEAKNSLDNATCRDVPLNYFVKPPANLVVLEGDCLDAIGDGGELESYLLATNDLYQDFILLDSCDAVAVDDFLKSDDKAGEGQNRACRGNLLTSKSRKNFQSPIRCSGATAHKLSVGKSQDANHYPSPSVDHGFEFNDCQNNNHTFEMDDGYSEPRDLDDSDDDDDPWKPLNPHEPGNLKVKPFKKVKACRREGVNTSKRVSIAAEFPLARLDGTISSELNEMWEAKHRDLEGQREPQSPPFYEKLRQSLVLGACGNYNAFCNPKDDNEDNEDDNCEPDFGPPDFEMPENTNIYEDGRLHPEKHDDGDAHFGTSEAHEHDNPNSQGGLEDLCRSHLDALLDSIAETDKQTELAARVSTWKQRIEQNLEEQDSRGPFDIHEYGERVFDKLSREENGGNAMSFADVVRGQQKHDVARTFSALLQLVNNGDVDLERASSKGEPICYTAVNPFYVRLLRHDKRRKELQLRSSKKRPKSLINKGFINGESNKSGKENRPALNSSPPGSTSTAIPSQQNGKFSLKMGKVGGARCTPDGKRRRRSRFAEPVDLDSAR